MGRTVEDFAEAYADATAAQAKRSYLRLFDLMRKRCESPIEEALLAALIWTLGLDRGPSGTFVGDDFTDGLSPPDGISLFLQRETLTYRADFSLEYYENEKRLHTVVTECDGHDYHERTKEQAARDKQRDRAMTEAGIVVLRFTGSEIWSDPLVCADQAYRVIMRMAYGPYAA